MPLGRKFIYHHNSAGADLCNNSSGSMYDKCNRLLNVRYATSMPLKLIFFITGSVQSVYIKLQFESRRDAKAGLLHAAAE